MSGCHCWNIARDGHEAVCPERRHIRRYTLEVVESPDNGLWLMIGMLLGVTALLVLMASGVVVLK
jgi:hypothetical protein